MTIAELMGAVATLKQVEATVAAMRGAFLLAGDVSFSRQANDIGLLVRDLIEQVEREIAKQQTP